MPETKSFVYFETIIVNFETRPLISELKSTKFYL